jgi:hypothetical protein
VSSQLGKVSKNNKNSEEETLTASKFIRNSSALVSNNGILRAHSCALREGRIRHEVGAQNLAASHIWEVAGVSNSSVEGEEGKGWFPESY